MSERPWILAPRYKADESLLELIVPIATELVECPLWLRMTGGGTAHRMYRDHNRVIERPFFQMYRLAIAYKRFDILGRFSVSNNFLSMLKSSFLIG